MKNKTHQNQPQAIIFQWPILTANLAEAETGRTRDEPLQAEPLIAAKAKERQVRKPESVPANLPEQNNGEARQEHNHNVRRIG